MPRTLALLALIFLTVVQVAISQQKSSQFIKTTPMASIAGRITVHETIGRTYGEHPVAGLSLYLVRTEDAKALHELQRKCRRALAQTRSDPGATYEICTASQNDAARIIPTLAAAATGQTDRDGQYVFPSVAAGGRYQIVGVKYEGNEPTVIVGLTTRLKAGEEHKLNLSENADWTEAIPPGQ